MQPGWCQPVRQEFTENECEALPGVAYPGVRDNRSTINTKTGYDMMMMTSHETCKPLRHGSHSVTCNYTNACLYFASVHQMTQRKTNLEYALDAKSLIQCIVPVLSIYCILRKKLWNLCTILF